MLFPHGFKFGLANADHQVESYDPRYEDIWDVWERTQGKTKRGRACAFQDYYQEDIARAASLGTKIFRFSVSWAKVQLDDGSWNIEALDHYRDVAQCIQDNGMEVMVTLMHFTWPVWLEKQGGLIAPEFPAKFTAYAGKLSEHFGDLVTYWVSFNEPTQLVHGYMKPWWQDHYYMPPGMPEGTNVTGEAEAVGKLVRNLFLAHARARVAIKSHHPETKVGVNPLVTGFPPWLQWLLDYQFRSRRLLRALYKFSLARPLIVEKTHVDIVIGHVEPHQQDTLHYSLPFLSLDGETKNYVAMPAGFKGLLQAVNDAVIIATDSESPIYNTVCQRPLSLADHFELTDGTGKCKTFNDPGLKRIKRRGSLTIGVTRDTEFHPNTRIPVGPEHIVAQEISRQIFGDPDRIEYVKVPAGAAVKALSTKRSKLNKLWYSFGAVGLIANANWWYLGSRGKLPKQLCPPEAYGAHDFIGLDYYWGLPTKRLFQFGRLIDAAEGRFLNAPVWPEGLTHCLRQFHRWFPEQEKIIIENGSVPLADGLRRHDYLRLHLREVKKAIKEGINVKAYLLWSLTSNREWGHKFDHNTDFGLYFVDLDNDPDLKRQPSPEVSFYRDYIQNHSSPE